MEMLAVLLLLAAFSVVSAKLFTSMMRQMRTTAAAQTAAARFDTALTTLRADVWSAQTLQTDGPTLILITGPHTVTWLADDKGNLSRTETGPAPITSNTRRWTDLPTRLSFSVQGPSVSLHVYTPPTRNPHANRSSPSGSSFILPPSSLSSDTLPLFSEAASLHTGANP